MICIPRRRLRLLSVGLAMLSLAATVFFRTLSLMLAHRLLPSDHPGAVLDSLEAVLSIVISDYLRGPVFAGETSNGPIVDINTTSRILAIQDSLKCFTEGTWDVELHRRSYRFSRLYNPSLPRYLLSTSCSSFGRVVNSTAELCALFATKSILLVGPETTFYLHSLWLRALEELENRRHRCLGLEFCTFHHICQHRFDRNNASTFDNADGRFRRPPSQQDLSSSGTSVLRYVLSTSLYMSNDPNDPAYIQPVVDKATRVRVRNNYWRAHAKRADIIILNRGPLPAPAWTYSDHDARGNWSFVDQLYLDKSTLYFNGDNSFTARVINAALHATLVSFLPSAIRSLSALRGDPILRQKILVWHGSWYLQPLCPGNRSLGDHGLLMGDPFALQSSSVIDSWSLYYNAQVYMQNRLMRDILPHLGIVFLPLSHPPPLTEVRILGGGDVASHNKQSHAKDCLTYPFSTPSAKAMETNFLGSLVRLAGQTS